MIAPTSVDLSAYSTSTTPILSSQTFDSLRKSVESLQILGLDGVLEDVERGSIQSVQKVLRVLKREWEKMGDRIAPSAEALERGDLSVRGYSEDVQVSEVCAMRGINIKASFCVMVRWCLQKAISHGDPLQSKELQNHFDLIDRAV